MEFSKSPCYYDTFALRDIEGHETVMQKWPYFRAAASRKALLSMDPVPVKSCWNGMGMFLDLYTMTRRLLMRPCYSGYANRALRVG